MSAGPRRVALLVAYRGDAFQGFQRQAGFRTVQQSLEEAWTSVTGEEAVVHGSGRTGILIGLQNSAHFRTPADVAASVVRPLAGAGPITVDRKGEWLYFGPMMGTTLQRHAPTKGINHGV